MYFVLFLVERVNAKDKPSAKHSSLLPSKGFEV